MGGDGGEYAADGNGKGGVGESAGGAARRRPQPSKARGDKVRRIG